MGDIRIKVAKDKTELMKALRAGDDTNGPFQSYADILVFAASLGIQKRIRKSITEYSKEIDPIRQDIFFGKDYDQVINLIAVADAADAKVVANNEEAEEKRISTFEEYANAGLGILLDKTIGITDITECILLIINELTTEQDNSGEFDLTRFLG